MCFQNNIQLNRNVFEKNNIYSIYICLLNQIKPDDSYPDFESQNPPNLVDDLKDYDNEDIKVEKSKAFHELAECNKTDVNKVLITKAATSLHIEKNNVENADNNANYCQFTEFNSSNILKLTKMKWLTEDKDETLSTSSSSILSTSSSNCSIESQAGSESLVDIGDKYLSTILQLDKEHNLFGLSNITILGARPSKKISKEEKKAVFHQNAIVQICCGTRCCRHKSNTDLPSSLKCGGCRGCCADQSCTSCVVPCGTPCVDPPCCPSRCVSSCPRGKCKLPCPPSKCLVDCGNYYGLKITLNKKPKYEQAPLELTPRSSCVLQKPLAARSCHHLPQCIPPSGGFPYLMPCYWPARPSAPCNTPTRCFHNPPCPAARKRREPPDPDAETCTKAGKCSDNEKKCANQFCKGVKEIEPDENDISNTKKKKKKVTCECQTFDCTNCFVRRPQVQLEENQENINAGYSY